MNGDLMLSTYLERARVPCSETLLVRHADKRVKDDVLYAAWRHSDPAFETYYRTQSRVTRPYFHDAYYLAMFVKQPYNFMDATLRREHRDMTLFIGLFEVIDEPTPCGPGSFDALCNVDSYAENCLFYTPEALRPIEPLSEYVGRLLIDWPLDKRQAWRQWADQQDKRVVKILDEPDGPFPFVRRVPRKP